MSGWLCWYDRSPVASIPPQELGCTECLFSRNPRFDVERSLRGQAEGAREQNYAAGGRPSSSTID